MLEIKVRSRQKAISFLSSNLGIPMLEVSTVSFALLVTAIIALILFSEYLFFYRSYK